LWSYFLFIEVRFWNEKHDGDGFNLLLHFSKKPWHTAYAASEAAEDEEKKQREIEAAKEKAAEQERLAAILKSTERNIDAFIQEGLSKQHQQDDGN